MTNLTKQIHNVETGEIEVMELTGQELQEYNERIANDAILKAQEIADKEQARANKISAYQKLGLTPAEIEAILPTPAEPI
jgi:hypothetical protein